MLWQCWAVYLSAPLTLTFGTYAGGRPQGKIMKDRPVSGGEEAVPIHFVLLSTLNPPWARDQFRNAIQGHSLKDVKMPNLHRVAEWKPGEDDLQEAEHRRAWKSAVEQPPGTWTIIVEDARGFAKVLSQHGADFLKAGLRKNKNQPGSSGSWVDLNKDCKADGRSFGYAVSPRSAATLLVLGRKPEPVRDIREGLVTQGRLSEGCVSLASGAATAPVEDEGDFDDSGAESVEASMGKDTQEVVGKSQFLEPVSDTSSSARGTAVRRSGEGSDLQIRRSVQIWDFLGILDQYIPTGAGGYFLPAVLLLVFLTCGSCIVVYVLPPEAVRAKIWQIRQSMPSKSGSDVSGAGAKKASIRRSDPPQNPKIKQAFKGCSAIDAHE